MRILNGLWSRYQRLRRHVVDDIRSAKTLGLSAPLRFRADRRRPEYQRAFDVREPLVSICIPTYNRSDLLVTRAVRSCLDQTYKNIEIIVIGDCCTDDTVARMAEVRDPRVRFENLSERGNYPKDPQLMWFVAGCVPFNRGLELARGEFITHLDHDDEYTPDRIEKLVEFSQSGRVDFVYHPFWRQRAGGWDVNPATRFELGYVTTSSAFYHRYFAKVEGDLHSYLNREPGDWNRWRRIRFLGARIRRHPDPMLLHYEERSMIDGNGGAMEGA